MKHILCFAKDKYNRKLDASLRNRPAFPFRLFAYVMESVAQAIEAEDYCFLVDCGDRGHPLPAGIVLFRVAPAGNLAFCLDQRGFGSHLYVDAFPGLQKQ